MGSKRERPEPWVLHGWKKEYSTEVTDYTGPTLWCTEVILSDRCCPIKWTPTYLSWDPGLNFRTETEGDAGAKEVGILPML